MWTRGRSIKLRKEFSSRRVLHRIGALAGQRDNLQGREGEEDSALWLNMVCGKKGKTNIGVKGKGYPPPDERMLVTKRFYLREERGALKLSEGTRRLLMTLEGGRRNME